MPKATRGTSTPFPPKRLYVMNPPLPQLFQKLGRNPSIFSFLRLFDILSRLHFSHFTLPCILVSQNSTMQQVKPFLADLLMRPLPLRSLFLFQVYLKDGMSEGDGEYKRELGGFLHKDGLEKKQFERRLYITLPSVVSSPAPITMESFLTSLFLLPVIK